MSLEVERGEADRQIQREIEIESKGGERDVSQNPELLIGSLIFYDTATFCRLSPLTSTVVVIDRPAGWRHHCAER